MVMLDVDGFFFGWMFGMMGKKGGAGLFSKLICVVAQLFCVKIRKAGKKNLLEGQLQCPLFLIM